MRQLLPEVADINGAADLEAIYLQPASHLRLNFVASLDGAYTIDGRSGPLGGPADRAAFHAMRAVADVILVGAGTARTENYGPPSVAADAAARRGERGQTPAPVLAVVTKRADLDPSARLLTGTERVLILTTGEGARRRPDLAELAEIVICGDSDVDLVVAKKTLSERSAGRVLCEGGPALTRALIAKGLADELCLTLSPLLAGDAERPALSARQQQLRLTGLVEGDGMLLTRYVLGERS